MTTYEESATELEMDLSGINLANDGIRFAAKYKGRSFPVVIPLDAVRYGLSFPPEYIDSKDARQRASAGDILTIPLMRAQISAYQAKERQVLAMDEQPLPGDAPAIVA